MGNDGTGKSVEQLRIKVMGRKRRKAEREGGDREERRERKRRKIKRGRKGIRQTNIRSHIRGS